MFYVFLRQLSLIVGRFMRVVDGVLISPTYACICPRQFQLWNFTAELVCPSTVHYFIIIMVYFRKTEKYCCSTNLLHIIIVESCGTERAKALWREEVKRLHIIRTGRRIIDMLVERDREEINEEMRARGRTKSEEQLNERHKWFFHWPGHPRRIRCKLVHVGCLT